MLFEEPLPVTNENFIRALDACEYRYVNGIIDGCNHDGGTYYWHGYCEKCGSMESVRLENGDYSCGVRQCNARFTKCEYFELLKELCDEVGVIHTVKA